jgi:hypothetical protein
MARMGERRECVQKFGGESCIKTAIWNTEKEKNFEVGRDWSWLRIVSSSRL